MRAGALRRVDVFVAGLAQDEAAALAPLVVEPQGAWRARSVVAFEPDLETADGERLVRRLGDLHDPLPQASFGERRGAIITIGIVAALALQHMRYPGAAAPAGAPVITRSAKAAAAIAVTPDRPAFEVAQRVVDRHRPGFAGGEMRFG